MRLSLVTLLVRDYDEAIEWFCGRLGFELLEDTALSAQKRWVVLAARDGGSSLLLAKAAGEEQSAAVGHQVGGRVAFFLTVQDFDAEHRRMKAAGIRFLEAPRSEPYGIVAVFEDLYANRWDLIEPRRTA